ncbi:hypothetical protein DPMN_174611 [Dreissena polymorpha]|uniref:G-protein coupled receptors family 1 profile domain-containing protein n=1 Tax=Dreissena polymorpha TaxID=45954 RepID=A0A9D4IIR0_DREPO|nr:hypothetical protein DPMN_174611 [Dreissena polymorpha]
MSGNVATTDASMEHKIDVNTCLMIVIYLIATLTGLFLNSLVIFVHSAKLKKSTHILTFCLAVSDLINCLSLVAEVVKLVNVLSTRQTYVIDVVQSYVGYFAGLMSAGLVVCVAVDRYMRVRNPHVQMSLRYSGGLIAAFLTSTTVVTLPYVVVRATNPRRRAGNQYAAKYTEVSYMCSEPRYETRVVTLENNSTREITDIAFDDDYFQVAFLCVLIACLLLGFAVLIVVYCKLSGFVVKKNILRMSRPVSSREVSSVDFDTDDRSSILPEVTLHISHPRPHRQSRVAFETDLSRTVREQALLNKIHAIDYKSGNTETHAEPSTPLNHFRVPYRKSGEERHSSNTFSITSNSRTNKISCRIVLMMVLAVVLYIFYTPSYIFQLIMLVNKPLCGLFRDNIRGISVLLLRSNIICCILNPVLYAFCNRRFRRTVKGCCFATRGR